MPRLAPQARLVRMPAPNAGCGFPACNGRTCTAHRKNGLTRPYAKAGASARSSFKRPAYAISRRLTFQSAAR